MKGILILLCALVIAACKPSPTEVSPPILPSPFQLKATPVDLKRITLAWKDTGSVYGYSVYRKTAATSYARIATVLLPYKAYNDFQVVNGTLYTYKVNSINDFGVESPPSNEVTATTMLTPVLGSFTLPNKMFGDPPFTITPPTSTSSAPFLYYSSNTAVAKISGDVVTIVGPGKTTIRAAQDANSEYVGGVETSAELTVNFTPLSPNLRNFVPLKKFTYNPSLPLDELIITPPESDNKDVGFVYTSSDESIAKISLSLSSHMLTLIYKVVTVKSGTVTITARQPASGLYAEGSISATVTLVK
jgi:hypothetical protein